MGTERPKLASDRAAQKLRDSWKGTKCPTAQVHDEILENRSQGTFFQQSPIPGCFLVLDFKAGPTGLNQEGSVSSDICPSDISLPLSASICSHYSSMVSWVSYSS